MIKHLKPKETILSCLDAMTFAVPAELPIAMSIGIIFALSRLKRKHISCTNISRINVSGRVSTMVFDKTGTLTENCILMSKLKIVDNSRPTPKFVTYLKDSNSDDIDIWNDPELYKQNKNNLSVKYFELMASCHSLALFDETILGDPLEQEMFKAAGWEYYDSIDPSLNRRTLSFYPKNSKYRLQQLHQFNFEPELQRMSVIVKNNFDETPYLLTKGSPEKLYDLCSKHQLPDNYFDVLLKYTRSGKRVIALAFKPLQNLTNLNFDILDRADFEFDLQLLGFLIFTNPIMSQTIPSISKLKKGMVKCIMATGDNLLTSISVAESCGILTLPIFAVFDIDPYTQEFICKYQSAGDEMSANDTISTNVYKSKLECDEYDTLLEKQVNRLIKSSTDYRYKNLQDVMRDIPSNLEIAITGKAFEYLLNKRSNGCLIQGITAKDIVHKIILCGKVYARMSPDHKEILIRELQGKTAETIGMCGDGANDCKALKVADVGLSLSEAEASIAAPFTSNVQNISSVVELLILGRFSLDISYCLFKFMIINTTIEFCSCIILYYNLVSISDNQFVCIDMLCLMPMTMFLCMIDPKQELSSNSCIISKFCKSKVIKSESSYYPPNSLLDKKIFLSIIGQVVITAFGIFGIYFCLKSQSFYKPETKTSEINIVSISETMIFTFTLPLYIFVGILFYLTSGFKASVFSKISLKNLLIISCVVIQLGITFCIILHPFKFTTKILDLVAYSKIDIYFRCIIAAASIVTSLILIGYEYILQVLL